MVPEENVKNQRSKIRQEHRGAQPAGEPISGQVSGLGTSPFSGSATSSDQGQPLEDAAAVLQGSEGFQVPTEDPCGVSPAEASSFSSLSSPKQAWGQPEYYSRWASQVTVALDAAQPQDPFSPGLLSGLFLSGWRTPDSPRFRHL